MRGMGGAFPTAEERSFKGRLASKMTEALQDTILLAFPPVVLGDTARELRRLAQETGNGAILDQVTTWTDIVDVLLAGVSEYLPGHIMFMDEEGWRNSPSGLDDRRPALPGM